MPHDHDVADVLIAATLRLAAAKGWRTLSLAEIATAAGLGLAEAYAAAPSKAALLATIIAAVDQRVLAGGPAGDGETPRDRLFEVLMRRFDALQVHRDGYAAIVRDIAFDPPVLLQTLPVLARSMTWMLDAAAIDTGGPLGGLRIKVVGALYANTLRTWLDDDSVDLARTMAVLDRGLRRIEDVVNRCPRLAGPKTARPSDEGAPPATEPPAAEDDSGSFADSSPADT